MKKRTACMILLLLPFLVFAKAPVNKPQPQKVVTALRTSEPIQIDGFLNEKVWKEKGYSDFVQSDPHDGADPTEKTTVWIAYDDKALYVAGCLFDSSPEGIKSRLGRRDEFVDSDWFFFSVDPYYDKRTGFEFGVNPAGSIIDMTLYNDEWRDSTWDGIWECKTQVNGDGWCVEIRIPYNQLRFKKKTEYTWGVNFSRVIKRKNERISYVWVPKEESGYVSRFAKLEGLKNIFPGRFIELNPYTVGQAQFSPAEDGNPFQTGQKYLGNVGFDLKVGLSGNLTLDATVNPDFGQVEVDPAVVNLSAYETYYSEKRPFFIEGANIFNGFGRGGTNSNTNINWSSPRFFYSRRIGRAPQGYVSQEGYVNYPGRTNILGAMKLSGKVRSWNFGFINALTAREFARIDFQGDRFKEEVEPFSYYGVLRGQREFKEGRHGIGFLGTTVIRDIKNQTLDDLINKRAFSLAVDGWTFLDKNKAWVLTGWLGGTRVEGTEDALLRLQYSSIHYFQRPDATHVEVDEHAKSLMGWGGRLMLNKQKGNVIFNAALGALSPGFNPNDVGFQFGSSDIINGHILFGYRQPHPGKVLRRWSLVAAPFASFDFGGNKNWEGYLFGFNAQFLNYWMVDTMIAYNPKTMSKTLTRGGPLAQLPRGYQGNLGIFTDSRKAVVLSAFGNIYTRPTDGYSMNANVSLRWKPIKSISLSMGPGYSRGTSSIQWVRKVDDPYMLDTFGSRYVFGGFEQKMLSAEIRLNWAFSPKLTLQLYLQPFIAVGMYDEFKELARPISFEYNIYGEGSSTISYDSSTRLYTVDPDGPGPASAFSFSNPDFNVKSLRGTVVLRWEYLPGSVLYAVWTQSRADYSNPGDFQFGRDIGNLFTARGDNIFLIKVSYRWNM